MLFLSLNKIIMEIILRKLISLFAMKKTHLMFALVSVLNVGALNGVVSTVLLTSPMGDSSDIGFAGNTLGFAFTTPPVTPILVDGLGAFDHLGDGLATETPVGLWSADKVLVVAVTVPSGVGGDASGRYFFADVTPTLLSVNSTYIIGAYYTPDNDDDIGKAPTSFGPAAPGFTTVNTNTKFVNNVVSLTFPGSTNSIVRLTANLSYTVVPEASSYASLMMCLMGFWLISRLVTRVNGH